MSLSPSDLRSLLSSVGLNQRSFAALYGLHHVTVNQWLAVPAWVEPALLDRQAVLSLNATCDALRRELATLRASDASLPQW